MVVLSKEEFRRRLLRDQRIRKAKEYRRSELEVEAYLGQQKGKRKYALQEY